MRNVPEKITQVLSIGNFILELPWVVQVRATDINLRLILQVAIQFFKYQ
jgi:hypothetical protein